MVTIFDALAASKRGYGKVYAQNGEGDWMRIWHAETHGFTLYVQSFNSMKWFVPQEWDYVEPRDDSFDLSLTESSESL